MSLVDGIIKMVTGVTDEQLAEVQDALPATSKLIALSKQAEPLLTKAEPLFDELLPLYQQAKPMITEALAEWKLVAPALQIVIGVIAKKTKAGTPLHEAVASVADEYPITES
jgi:hypothetical protein